MCPIRNALGNVTNNTAHANICFGLRIFILAAGSTPATCEERYRPERPLGRQPFAGVPFFQLHCHQKSGRRSALRGSRQSRAQQLHRGVELPSRILVLYRQRHEGAAGVPQLSQHRGLLLQRPLQRHQLHQRHVCSHHRTNWHLQPPQRPHLQLPARQRPPPDLQVLGQNPEIYQSGHLASNKSTAAHQHHWQLITSS